MKERKESGGEFVVTRGDASELFDAGEETLDQVALLLAVLSERQRVASGWNAARDYDLTAMLSDCRDKGIEIVALVGNDEGGRLIWYQSRHQLDVGAVPCREDHPQRIARGIYDKVKVDLQAADFLAAGFFGARRMLIGPHNG